MSRKFPGYSDEAHPELFTVAPPQPKVLKAGQLSEEQVKRFFTEGFIVLESFFTEEELNPAKDAVDSLVDELAQKLYKGGKIKELYSEYGYEERLTKLEAEFTGANILLHKIGRLPQAFRDVWSNERVLDVIEQLIGTSNIAGHPAWNLRCKTPNSEGGIVPWHQDAAYMDNRSYRTLQITGWIPLMDADAESGCMQLVRYGHKTGRVATHTVCHGNTWHIVLGEDEMRTTLGCDLEKDIVTCPLKYGGLILFSNVLPHQSLHNTSDKIRWSLDFRWQTAEKSVGFYDLKNGIQLRSAADPNFNIDWEPFDSVSRHDRHAEVEKVDEFETTVVGPWMVKWELTHHNRHTAALPKDMQGTWGNLVYG